jgi:hypothetical protein
LYLIALQLERGFVLLDEVRNVSWVVVVLMPHLASVSPGLHVTRYVPGEYLGLLIKKYNSTLELERNEIERATNLPQGVKHNLERMKKEGTISERGIKRVLAGERTLKSNPQGYLKLVEVKK